MAVRGRANERADTHTYIHELSRWRRAKRVVGANNGGRGSADKDDPTSSRRRPHIPRVPRDRCVSDAKPISLRSSSPPAARSSLAGLSFRLDHAPWERPARPRSDTESRLRRVPSESERASLLIFSSEYESIPSALVSARARARARIARRDYISRTRIAGALLRLDLFNLRNVGTHAFREAVLACECDII